VTRPRWAIRADWGILIICLIAACAVARAESICGARIETPQTDMIRVGCIDFDALRAVAPEVPWPLGKVTQVLVHAKTGDAVRVTVDGVTKWADLFRDPYGQLAALVQFDGAEHTSVDVKVYIAVD